MQKCVLKTRVENACGNSTKTTVAIQLILKIELIIGKSIFSFFDKN